MKIASLREVKNRFSHYVDETANGPVVVTKNGKAAVVMLHVRDDEYLEDLLIGHSPKVQAILERSRQSIRQGKSKPLRDVRRERKA